MTIYMTFRQATVGGGIKDPTFLEGDGTVLNLQLKNVTGDRFARLVAKRDVLFAIHGFNVAFAGGACALGRLEASLNLPPTYQFVAVLWPGDQWIPIVNYPFEGSTAIDCGRRLAAFVNRKLGAAASFSFVTHSLGARVALEAATYISRRVRSTCLLAGAINADCLSAEYADAFARIGVVSLLASRRDLVLKLAFPIGDPIADLLHFDHNPVKLALGYQGPPAPLGATTPPWQIADASNYNHGDYLPPSDPNAAFPAPTGKWTQPASFVAQCLTGARKSWP